MQWNSENTKTIQINEDEIESIEAANGNTYTKSKIKDLFKTGGKSTTDGEAYEDILKHYFKNKIQESDQYNTEYSYHVIVSPSKIGFGEGGFAPNGETRCYIQPPSVSSYNYILAHELGHNLSLNHIWEDLGKEEDNYDPYKGVGTNNIMDYNEGNSFWIWQGQEQ